MGRIVLMFKRLLALKANGPTIVVLLSTLLLTVQCSTGTFNQNRHTPAALTVKSVWPHQKSDQDPDPGVTFGRLANGVRYILKENHTPSDRVSMHLYVQAGSLLETEKERGSAHFLEHMLFNGTTHFAPGEMVKYFQRIGMQFGPDANAHTGFGQTVYDVILPKGDRASVSEGLLVLRDYADGALLLPEEVERERKVILAEMRSRDSASYRTFKSTFEFELPDLLISNRFPIGEAWTIGHASADLLRGFYEAWYRPERMILVLVGDFKTSEAQDLITRRFADFEPRGTKCPLPDMGTMDHRGVKSFFHQEDEAGATTVAIEAVVQELQPSDSKNWRRQMLEQDLANKIMQKRLDIILQRPGTVLTSADIGAGHFLQQFKYTEVRADCKPEEWQKALAIIENALRKALTYGFTPTELQLAKDGLLAQLIRAEKEGDTRESSDLARGIMSSLNNWRVFQSPRQQLNLLKPVLEATSLKQVNQAFNNIWAVPHRLVLVTGNVNLSSDQLGSEEKIIAAYQASQQMPVQPPNEKKAAVFPYLPRPSFTGTIDHRNQISDIGIEKVQFTNGFRLHLKPTQYKANQVLVALSFGAGKFSEPADQPGLAKLTGAVVNGSGFGTLDRIELEDALAGRSAHTQLEIREDMFVVNGEAITSELPLLFQLLHTFVQDPGFREDALKLALNRFEQEYKRLPCSVEGMLQVESYRFLSGGDSRFGLPPWEQLQQRTLKQIKQWYGHQLQHAPLELAVVGDFQPDMVVELAARYFGSMPKRVGEEKVSMRPGPSFPQGQSLELTANTGIPKALVVVAYPTEDFWDIRRTRRLTVMAALLSERLRQHIRENLGAAYSPFAYNRSHRSYEGYGLAQIYVRADPNQVDTIVDEVQKIVEQLAANGSDPDEFRRVLDPTLTHIKDLRQTNKYWLNSVLTGVGRHPQQMDWCRTFEKDYASITADEIAALVRKYLINGKAATVVIKPIKEPMEE